LGSRPKFRRSLSLEALLGSAQRSIVFGGGFDTDSPSAVEFDASVDSVP